MDWPSQAVDWPSQAVAFVDVAVAAAFVGTVPGGVRDVGAAVVVADESVPPVVHVPCPLRRGGGRYPHVPSLAAQAGDGGVVVVVLYWEWQRKEGVEEKGHSGVSTCHVELLVLDAFAQVAGKGILDR